MELPPQPQDPELHPRPKTQERTDRDGAWKTILEELLSPALQICLPELWAKVDWSVPPVFLDKELPRLTGFDTTDQRFVDKLVQLQLKDGQAILVILHIEIQDRRQHGFSYRMYCYYFHLEHQYGATHQIVSLALLTDLQADWRPQVHERSAFGTNLSFSYPIIKLVDFEDHLDELITTGNPFALVIAAHLKAARTKRKPGERRDWKTQYLRLALQHKRTDRETCSVLNFIDRVMKVPPRLDSQVKQSVELMMKEAGMYFGGVFGPLKKQAYDEGMADGKAEGMASLLIGMLANKFGMVPDAIRSKIEGAPVDALTRWANNILLKNNLDEIIT